MNNSVSDVIRLWVDCDAGVDDAQALVLCLSSKKVETVGISCVFGNVDVEQVARNVARVCMACGKDVPIYVGAADPLICERQDASWFHGKDGLGDAPHAAPAALEVALAPVAGHAAIHLVNAVNDSPHELVVVAIGPLTNIALAVKLDPTLPAKWKRLVVMGGSEAIGNTTPTAEFNFVADPEAARLVLAACPMLTLVSWECVQRHAVPHATLAEWAALPHPKARFLMAVLAKSLAAEQAKYPGVGWWPCDSVAVAAAVRPDLVAETTLVWGAVEVQGSSLVRGMLVLDWHNKLKRQPNLELLGRLQHEQFQQLLTRSLMP